MVKLLDKIFILTLVAFLFLGGVIVFTQIAGLIFQQGEMIIKVNNLLAEPAFILSAIAGILGFIIPALKNKSSNILSEEEMDERNLEQSHST